MSQLIVFSVVLSISVIATFAATFIFVNKRSVAGGGEKDEVFRQRLQDKEEACQKLIAAEKDACKRALAEKEIACNKMLEEKTRECTQRIADNNRQIETILKEREKRFEEATRTLQEKFSVLAEEKLKNSAEGLSLLNQKNLNEVIKPFKDEIDRFRVAFESNKEQQIKNKASFEQAINDLGRQTMQIGDEAKNLVKALKRDPKKQGNWGELVLTNILSAAGLTENRDYLTQEYENDEKGNRLFPDVEFLLPNNEKLLIDSKTSLTAYLKYMETENEEEKKKALADHVNSVKRHMEELAEKDYLKKVRGSQSYILMFIPNESSYLLAMENAPSLAMEAFKRHVIIVNPTTLLLCLQIVALLRSREAQNENAEKISKSAAKMYEKFVNFAKSFIDIGKNIDTLKGTYTTAYGRLCEGNANVIKQLESLKDMGIVTAHQIPQKILEAAQVTNDDEQISS